MPARSRNGWASPTKAARAAIAPTKTGEPIGLNFQNRGGKIPRYQAEQLIAMIDKYEGRTMTDSHPISRAGVLERERQGFIAVAPDLPGCSAFGDTQQDALD